MDVGEEFVIKEFEVMHESVALHYRIIERIFYLYAIVASIPFLAMAYVLKTPIDLIDGTFTSSLIIILLFVVTLGIMIFRLVIEHKLKVINYIRNINGIRAFMISKHDNIKNFSLMPTKTDFPKYFDILRDFFWEASIIAFTNSVLVSLLITNLLEISSIPRRKLVFFASVFAIWSVQFLWYWRIAKAKY